MLPPVLAFYYTYLSNINQREGGGELANAFAICVAWQPEKLKLKSSNPGTGSF